MEAFYFGEADRRLFGIYHAPRAEGRRGIGLLLCYPFGQEYIRSHRSFRQLAVRASHGGFPVLRFDYYGCGDSMGRREEGSVRQWLNDVSTAIAEIRGRGRVSSVCLVGLRLGAWLAMLAAVKDGDVAGLVLWDPIHDGKAYLEELAAAHQQHCAAFGMPHSGQADTLTEALGFPLAAALSAEFRRISLSGFPRRPAPHILVIDSGQQGDGEAVSNALTPLGSRVEAWHVQGATWAYDQAGPVSKPGLLQSIVAWVNQWLP